AVKSRAEWEKPEFLAGWGEVPANGGEIYGTYRGECQIFGHRAQSVSGMFEDGQLASITIVVLDAGAWFGFVPDVQVKQVAATKGPQFAALYKQVSADTERGLGALAGGSGRKVPFVEKGALKQDVQILHCGDLWARLTCRENQLVKLTLTRTEEDAVSPLNALRRTAKKAEQAGKFAARVQAAENGDRLLDGVPIFIQGDRAYCGVATLAMAMQFMGLRLDTEDYADAAGIRFGSTRRSDIRGVFEAAAEVAKVHLPRTTRFDFARARACIDAGLPVIAFRRWSQERDFIHTAFARRLLKDPLATLPKPDLNDQKSWPTRDDFAHSSLITGYNAARREVIFTESWGEFSRNRRMRVEEMEGTAYFAYYPHL
ncbi:MAG TPA: C39 family peptidase, partial [Chthoniobacteraceae bacterium]|nr:C39 family peptidase [Chthoniobacteraceae bacterium]